MSGAVAAAGSCSQVVRASCRAALGCQRLSQNLLWCVLAQLFRMACGPWLWAYSLWLRLFYDVAYSL